MMRTGWFPISVRPIRVGWYEVRYGRTLREPHEPDGVRYWDGRAWLFGPGDGQCMMGQEVGDVWRGLAEDPERRKS